MRNEIASIRCRNDKIEERINDIRNRNMKMTQKEEERAKEWKEIKIL